MKIITVCLVVLATMVVPGQLVAQQTRYKAIVLKSFGGPQSYIPENGISDVKGAYLRVLTNDGTVTGAAETSTPDSGFCFDGPVCFVAHAFRWRDGVMTDIGTLVGNVSSRSSAISANGVIAGVSENPSHIDPVLGIPIFRGTLWKNKTITDVGALINEGGHTSPANGVNSRGQVVGFAFTSMPDPFSMLGVGFQARAYLSENGVIQDLGTLGGPDAEALLINNKGQVVGDSYINSTPGACGGDLPLTTGAFVWEQGHMSNVGSFGGTCTVAFALNNRGQVTGSSNLAGDQASHPYLWEHGSMMDLGTFGGSFGGGAALNEAGDVVGFATFPGDQVFRAALWKNRHIKDIGTLPGDAFSFAVDINAREQIIAVSIDAQFTRARAFLWEDGKPPLDLDSLIATSGLEFQIGPPGTGIANINDVGEIVGNATDGNGFFHAVVLQPCSEGDTACDDAESGARQVTSAKNTNQTNRAKQIRSMLIRRRILRTNRTLN
jgi:probable HAF family extracellular repeat protein